MKKKYYLLVAVAVIACVSLFVGCMQKSDAYDVVKTTKKDNYTFLNQSAEKGRIVLIGDSIVEIFPVELLDGAGKKAYNRGISGDFSSKVLERIDDNALNISPSAVFILVGTNDFNLSRSAEEIAGNIMASAQKCKSAGVPKVIVSSLLPVKKSVNPSMVGVRKNSSVREVNALLKTACEDNGAIYADIYSSVADADGEFEREYTYDGLHPNAKGYKRICDALLPLL